MYPTTMAIKTQMPSEIGTPTFNLGTGVRELSGVDIGLALGMLHLSIILVWYVTSTTCCACVVKKRRWERYVELER